MAQSGPNTAGTGADATGIGTVTWTSPGNVTASDNVYATASLALSATSHYLKATNFGFSIPANAVITGIKVEWEIKTSNANATENSIKLVKGGTISGNDKSTGAGIPTVEQYVSYGGSSDLWGLAWTPADINASTFGAVYSATNPTVKEGGNATISIDSCRITVFYTLPGSGSFFPFFG